MPPIYGRLILQQMMRIGYFSLPVVGLTAFFTGGALALQIAVGSDVGAETIVPQIVVLGITRELGPVMAGLMVAGRVSAAIAAELGTMRVTEQIDALVTLSTNPFKYLVAPRLIAAVLTMPLLVGIGDIIGVMGGWVVGVYSLDYNSASLPEEHRRLPEDRRRDLRPLEGRRLRLHHRADGLLPRLQFQGRRAGRGRGDHERRRLRRDPDPRRQLRHDLAVLRWRHDDRPRSNVKGVHKRFGSKVVLDGLDLTVMPGESMVIIGGSGTGKSVTIKSVLGLVTPDRGSIKVDGQEVTRLTGRAREKVNRKFGMLFQAAALFDSLTVWENVAFAPDPGPRPGPRAKPKRSRCKNSPKWAWAPKSANSRRPNFRAACKSASASRAPSPPNPKSSSSTNRPPASTRSWPTSSTT